MDNSDREEVYKKAFEKLTELGYKPIVTKNSLTKFIEGEDTDFGKSLCITGIDTASSSKACTEVNKIIKPYGAKLKPDNYNTVFLSCESTELDENFLSQLSKPVKNAKAHYAYLKKKQAANRTNGATAQKEMPKYNSISAGAELDKEEPIEESTGGRTITTALVLKLKTKHHLLNQDATKDGSWDKLHPYLLDLVSNAKTMQDISYLRVDLRVANNMLTKLANDIDDVQKGRTNRNVNTKNIEKRIVAGQSVKKINDHLKWLNGPYLKAINDKAKEIKKSVNESYYEILTEAEIELLVEAASKDMKPIFIVTSYTNTAFGKVITTYTHSTYSHASLSFDSSLEKLYSFNADNNQNKLGGLSFESMSSYIKQYKDTRICVSCIFVKNEDYENIMKALDKMIEQKSFTKYGYGNILNILLNRTREMSNDAMSMVCSQFVAYLLSRADIHITDKSANLVTPNDLSNIVNPRVYKLYEGLAREYDQKSIDRIFRKLKKKAELIKEQYQL